MYDIFYISDKTIDQDDWESFKKRFPTAIKLENVKSYNDIKSKSFTRFFWVVWDDLEIEENFDFSYKIPKWDEEYIHVFKNDSFYDGVFLFSKDKLVSEKEFKNRFFVNKKEIDILASHKKEYDIFYISDTTIDQDKWDSFKKRFPTAIKLENVKSYNDIRSKALTKMFWVVWDDLEILENFDFSYKVPEWDKEYIHVFKNGSFYNGVCLFSIDKLVSEREFKNRFFVNKKEINIVASNYKKEEYDIIFISYQEPNADELYQDLISRFPRAKRVHGVKGIHQAHIEAAKIANTKMFWVVDGDAKIDTKFNFEYRDAELFTVYVWTSINPVNKLTYGYGGVKLLPRKLTLNMDVNTPDMTTSISDKFYVVPKVSNITQFNIDPFSTWRSAFRECAKLAGKAIDRNYDHESETRLDTWCNIGIDEPYGEFSIAGAKEGRDYGYQNVGNNEALIKINDFDWIRERFEDWQKKNGQ